MDCGWGRPSETVGREDLPNGWSREQDTSSATWRQRRNGNTPSWEQLDLSVCLRNEGSTDKEKLPCVATRTSKTTHDIELHGTAIKAELSNKGLYLEKWLMRPGSPEPHRTSRSSTVDKPLIQLPLHLCGGILAHRHHVALKRRFRG